MYKGIIYTPEDSMSELICDNYPMLLVMSRFGINLGFGEDTIEQTCTKNNVDTYTFLAVVNILTLHNKKRETIDHNRISLASIVTYLHNSHTFFLEYRLPGIREKLVGAIDRSDDVSIVIINYFDEYVTEVNKHMMYEETTLFPYIQSMIEGHTAKNYSIGVFSKHHDKIEEKLSEFKNIIIKYYPAQTTNELNGVLYDIFSCERDLASHNKIEDLLLVPTIKELESQIKGK